MSIYKIRVKGHLDQQWESWFDGLAISYGSDETTLLCGHLADEAALHGILAKVRDLALPLLELSLGDGSPTGVERKAPMLNQSVSFATDGTGSTTVDVPPPLFLINELSRVMVIRALYWATRYGIAEFLRDGPQTVAELARKTEADPRTLYRLLRALESIGLFQEQPTETTGDLETVRFAQTLTSTFLLPETPGTLYPLILMWQSPFQWDAWGNIEYSLKTGKPALEARYGVHLFDFLAQHPAEQELFNQAMTSISQAVNRPIADAYADDFSRIQTLVEVGGGRGSFLETVLRDHPHLQVVLFEQAHVIEEVRQTECIAQNPRATFVSGDFFSAVPDGGDAYFLKQVLLNWSDDESVQILTNCRRAMQAGGRVLVAEQVLHPGIGNDTWGKFLDLQMLVTLRGGNRTEREYRELFARAGLKVTRIQIGRAHV